MNKIIDSFFPLSCTFCHLKNLSICTTCLYSLKRSTLDPLIDTFALFSYQDKQVKLVLQRAKYSHQFSLYQPLSKYLAEKLPQTYLTENEKLVVIPMPMHFLRRLFRGQNHAEHIARHFAESLHLPYTHKLLFKVKYTRRQALLSRSQRATQQKNSFSVKASSMIDLQDFTIILIDDIVTTGSTILEAKKTLELAGAKKVITVVLAH